MEHLCEFCGVMRAVVYCKPDLARLCLHCDSWVHFANSLSRSHAQSLLCEKCNAEHAIIRCMDGKVYFYQLSDWNTNGYMGMGYNAKPLTVIRVVFLWQSFQGFGLWFLNRLFWVVLIAVRDCLPIEIELLVIWNLKTMMEGHWAWLLPYDMNWNLV